ncbi:glycosyltransferase family 2 protein [uncultured Bacteroides sp.]|uniref:glycosyltransferase family 2 protein n=1 Tax=uncultured Bacteroides sp. TaxID=162156 RepID=UPI0025F59833|nr:glycosyltransferase family 2 protein [uncultured Bacteroides sp.]
MNPLVSIIVPIYNSENYLNRCLDSILSQTFCDWELILIDDGSTDQSVGICEEYAQKDNRIRVFHKQNGGVSSARNIGLKNAKGEWVTFCDSDDFVNPDWLEIYIPLIYDNEISMVCQGIHRIGPFVLCEYCSGIEYVGDNRGALELLYKSLLLGFVWNKIFKKSILDDYNLYFDERFIFMEDENFVLRYLKHCKRIVCVKRSGYNYNMPDLSCKYKNVDNYYTSLSNFESVKYIYHNKNNLIYQNYLNMVTNALYASYFFNVKDMKCRLKIYRQIVGVDIFKVEGLSFVSKVIFFFPINFVNCMFIVKDWFRKTIF